MKIKIPKNTRAMVSSTELRIYPPSGSNDVITLSGVEIKCDGKVLKELNDDRLKLTMPSLA